MKTLNEQFYDLILQNELSGNVAAALRFSNAKVGKSGLSFGVTQLDVRNNPAAVCCLVDCGFTQAEIHGLIDETINTVPLAARLIAHKDVVEKYDEAQLKHCLDSALNMESDHGVVADNPAGILALADYVNQYGSVGPHFVEWLLALGHPASADNVLTWKLTDTTYGEEHKADCQRRYDNLVKILKAEG
ncbi:MAG: hypothetical protein ABSA86_11445 [Oryzomonas sp.]|jgi:hypothetical protein